VSLFGGQVLSWRQASGDEVLFVRPDAVFDKSKPIAGGIPHCFPQFGPGRLPQHGFARLSEWSVASSSADPQPDDRDPEVQLTLSDSEQTRAAWPHRFQCAFSVSLHGESLRLDLRVVNVDSHAWSFTTALHSYFEVADLTKAAVRGLAGLTYLDKTQDANNPVRQTESRRQVTFEKAVDYVFLNASDYAEVCVGNGAYGATVEKMGAAISISSSGFPDMVVWNPGPSVPCHAQFVCAENAVAGEPVELQPGESWRGQVALAVVDRPLHASAA
ncbi:aldose 1-epimerase, partial [Helicosporidium sp. ATCC 50920]